MNECFVLFDETEHRLTGVIVGFALSHISHMAYCKWYEVLTALDEMYDHSRSINIIVATCLGHNNSNSSAMKNTRAYQKNLFGAFGRNNEEEISKQKALNFFYSIDSVKKGDVDPVILGQRVRYLLDLALTFARRTVRDHRLDIPVLVRGGDETEAEKAADHYKSREHEKHDGVYSVHLQSVGPFDMDDKIEGVDYPTVSDILLRLKSEEETFEKKGGKIFYYSDHVKIKSTMESTSHESRASACITELQRTIELARKKLLIDDEAAFDCYDHYECFMQSQTTIFRVIDTPVPMLYWHIVLTALFFYAFSVPFSFSSAFGWLSPIPSAVFVLGFYGASAVGDVLIDPLAWSIH